MGRTILAATVIAVTVTVGALSGCRLKRDFPPQPVEIVGTSYNPGITIQLPPLGPDAELVMPTDAGRTSLSAWGEADVPAGGGLDPLQGRLTAQQMARQDARRKIARQLETVEVRPGVTLAEMVRSDAPKREQIDDLIRHASQKGLIHADGGKITVFLTLEMAPVYDVLRGVGQPANQSSTVTVTAVSPQEFNKKAREEAVGNTRARALEYVKSLRLPGGDALGERMLRDPLLDHAVRAKIAALAANRVSSRDDGSAEAVVTVDLAEIQRIVIGRQSRWRLPWR